jgi:DNA-binding CsgD family transcriptional regulator
MEERRNRSSSYQHLMAETQVPSEMMDSFPNEDSISARLNPFEYSEELMDLEDELKKEFWIIVEKILTPRQKEVLRYYADGYTQMEIAKMLDVNQSSITKNIHGNIDYKKGRRAYGGSYKKLKKIIEMDEIIKVILDKMTEVRVNKW